MLVSRHVLAAESAVVPDVPAWVFRSNLRHASRRLVDAAALSAGDLSAAVTDAYLELMPTPGQPVRFWNFLPAINEPLDDRQTRYMAFNAGRMAAFERWPAARAATASGVGHAGRDVWIHCAWSDDGAGVPVDNPRQTPPHRYSARYGPRPPSFARATVVGRQLLIGGTASIRGEQTVHDDVPRQVAETLTNLDALVAAAGGGYRLGEMRVYHRPGVDPAALRPLLPRDWRTEWVAAELCRPELLVEIEGVAEATV